MILANKHMMKEGNAGERAEDIWEERKENLSQQQRRLQSLHYSKKHLWRKRQNRGSEERRARLRAGALMNQRIKADLDTHHMSL
ncbi:hypothetical protein NQZ68_042147 [Dissostichus eleginoides]|nr:hypothetical protein NQZ68_042147 [Dissostichus eleginoides]